MLERVAKELGNQDIVFLLLDFADNIDDKNIPDPYPTDTFPEAFNLINQGIKAFYYYLKNNYFESHNDPCN